MTRSEGVHDTVHDTIVWNRLLKDLKDFGLLIGHFKETGSHPEAGW